MSTATILLRLLLLSLTLRPISSTHHRRILHQPFQSHEPFSTPPTPSPPPSPPNYPSSNSTPATSPFFPSNPPPPPPPPSSPDSFPSNISSISVPRPSRPKPTPSKLIIASIAAVVAAVAVVSLAVFLHIHRRNHGSSSSDQCKTQRSDSSSTSGHHHHIPKLQRPPQTSSEFLYLGTLVSSHAPGGAAFNNAGTTSTTTNRNKTSSNSRKTGSPELRPLPPLKTQQIFRQNPRANNNGDVVSSKDDESEEFYSAKGSINDRESSIGTGSVSRRAFADVENFINESTSHSSSTYSSSVPGSDSGSPARSVSSSLSPVNNLSLINSIPKSQDLIEIQTIVPLPSPSPACSSSPERYYRRRKESSPRISNSSDQNKESPGKISTSVIPPPPEIGGPVLPKSASALSSPDRYSRRSEESESSTRFSNASEHNVESPARISSPVKNNIPTSPEIQGLVLPESSSTLAYLISSPRISDVSDHEGSPVRINSPLPPERCSTKSQESSPRISNASDPNLESPVRISSPVQQKSHMCLLSLPERYSTSEESSSTRASIDSDQNTESPTSISSPVLHYTVTVLPMAPPPPPPPPLPPSKVWESPKTPTPPPEKPARPPAMINPLRPIALERPGLISPIELPSSDSQMARNDENKETELSSEDTLKPKLKPLHWDKVRAISDREMVWDQFKCSTFKLNEEMTETLFVVNTPRTKPNPNETTSCQVLPSPGQDNGNRVLDPKKAQNIAILLKALHVTVDEVCEGLLEGNADILGTELLESLLKMAPSKEEERKLLEYKEEDDSPTKLGAAERFLKAVVDIPYAFRRVDAMLYVSNFDSEVEYLKNSFATLEAACEELRTSRMFLKLLEAVLKTGNRMNVGTNRGDAHAFKLDTLLKLVDVKGADGKTTLLHFVVQEIIRSEGAHLSSGTHHENSPSINDDTKCRKLGLQVVSALGLELSNVKKAAVMDAEALNSDVSKLSKGIENVREIISMVNDYEEVRGIKFSDSMSDFIKRGEQDIFRVRAHESMALSLVKEITEYFHGNSAKEEAHPFRIFMIVRDFIAILDRVCKEVGMINERTMVSSAHKFPVPVNPMLQ